jgi:uncharacterized membrane protein
VTNPFDLTSALLAKHAQHVVLVHFPIALTITAIAFDWLGIWMSGPRRAAVANAAYWNLTVAAATSVAAAATGFVAWRWQLDGTPLTGTLGLHALFGGASTLAILVLWWLRVRLRRRSGNSPGPVYLALTVLTLAIVALTGHLGGFVSGVNS